MTETPARRRRSLPILALLGTSLGLALAGAFLGGSFLTPAADAQAPAQPQPAAPPTQGPSHAPEHGTPAGWKFAWPGGDPAQGREAFTKLKCYACHEVAGERFPAPTEPGKIGPELSMMGPLHEAEYFAEAILNPDATIEKGKGYEVPDGTSKMPSFNDSMTVQELIDLVAYLRSLRPPPAAPHQPATGGHGGGH